MTQQRQRSPDIAYPRRRRAALRPRTSGASTLTVLAAIATTALMAVVTQLAMRAPHQRMLTTLDALSTPSIGKAPADRPFGACGDICSGGVGGCRYVVLRDGLHAGSRVDDRQLAAAEACH